MNKKIIILGLALSLIPAVSNARGTSFPHPHFHAITHKSSGNPFAGYKHTRVKRTYKGTVTIYKH